MTATAAAVEPRRTAREDGERDHTLAQALVLAKRSVRGTFRQPASFIPGIAFPLLIAAVNGAALGRVTDLPNFPYPGVGFLDFLMAATIAQGVLFGGVIGGSDLALDIENGFFERLLASPVSRPAILVGRLAGSAALGGVQVLAFTAVYTLFGVDVRGGMAGIAVMVLTAVVLAIGVGGLAAAVGLRTGSAEAVQNSFPLAFILLFVSSAFFPTEMMTGWYQSVASRNPLTPLIDGLRHQVVIGFDAGEAAVSLAIAGALAVGAIMLAGTQLSRRLRDVS